MVLCSLDGILGGGGGYDYQQEKDQGYHAEEDQVYVFILQRAVQKPLHCPLILKFHHGHTSMIFR